MEKALNPGKAVSRLGRGYLICLVGTVLWSSTAVFIRYLTETYHMPALLLAFWRDLIVFLTLATVFALFNPSRLRVGRENLRFLFFYGLVLSLFNALWTVSVALNGAAISTVLAYSSAAFTAILGWRIFKEQLGATKILAVVASIAGCALVSGALDRAAWQINPAGIVVGLISGLAFAAYSLMGKASSNRSIYPWSTLLYSFGFAAVFLLVYNLLPGNLLGDKATPDLLWLGRALGGWAMLAILAVGPTIGGYGLYTVSMTYLPASVANLIATLEPAMTAGLAYLLLNERMSVVQLVGSGLIISGVIILRMSEGRTAEVL
ncbi:MAG: EamA family transporter [Chloroflexota bacterium]|nr:MAG: EamA family transporter [Chloroflexota bacterium]